MYNEFFSSGRALVLQGPAFPSFLLIFGFGGESWEMALCSLWNKLKGPCPTEKYGFGFVGLVSLKVYKIVSSPLPKPIMREVDVSNPSRFDSRNPENGEVCEERRFARLPISSGTPFPFHLPSLMLRGGEMVRPVTITCSIITLSSPSPRSRLNVPTFGFGLKLKWHIHKFPFTLTQDTINCGRQGLKKVHSLSLQPRSAVSARHHYTLRQKSEDSKSPDS
jgi:hypothetical protein